MTSGMGSPGHAFIAHTKALSPAAQNKDGGYGAPPHPLVVRAGQRYWPRGTRRRTVLTVRRVVGDHVVVDAPRRGKAPVRLSEARLLAVRPDGQGAFYQFLGFATRRYVTCAYVWSVDDSCAVLCVPEWHPARAVRLPLRLVPPPARTEGAWLEVRCDLSASSAGRLQLADLVPREEPTSWHPIAIPRLNRGIRSSRTR